MVRKSDGTCEFILSEEGVTQGDPLAMILYGLALVPLAEQLRKAFPDVIQPFYANDAVMAGRVSRIAAAMRLLETLGPARGYFPEASKSIFIVRPEDEAQSKVVLREFNFKYTSGNRYIGGFIGSAEKLDEWLTPQIDKWVAGIRILGRAAKKYPQTAYSGLVRSLQTEWTYLQRVVPGTEAAFKPIEKALMEDFLPALLGDSIATAATLREQTCLPVRFSGLGIPNPVSNARFGHDLSVKMTASVSGTLRVGAPLNAMAYARESEKILRAANVDKELRLECNLAPLLAAADPAAARRMTRSRDTGAWLTAVPNLFNGTELSADEFRDSL